MGKSLVELDQQIQQIFFQEEKNSEGLVNYARFFISILCFAAVWGAREQIPVSSAIAAFAGSATIFVYSIFLYWYLRKGSFNRTIKYISTFLDIIVLSLVISSFGGYRVFKTPVFLIYFFWVGLIAMRFSARLVLISGIFTVVVYIGVIVAASMADNVVIGTYNESLVSQKVSLLRPILNAFFLSCFIFIAWYISRSFYRIVEKSVAKEAEVISEKNEKDRIKSTFSRYVTTQVADKVLSQGLDLTGEAKKATVLFCDIRDFTHLTEMMTPHEIVSFLNEYLSLMIDVIFEYGGTLDKFVGDEIMAVFGAPVSQPEDAAQAVRAAVKMREKLSVLNEKRQFYGYEPLRFGIAIHTGEVVAGNIGSEKRMEYTVIGKTVNVASRLEALNKKFATDILISQETYDEVKDLISVKQLSRVLVKGVTEPVRPYHLLSLTEVL